MSHITAEQFKSFADQGYNHIPVVKEVLADLETPLSAYLKLADAPYTCLLESVTGGETWGRYSFIGLPSDTILTVQNSRVKVKKKGNTIFDTTTDNPFAEIEKFKHQYRSPELPNLPRFSGGLAGYFAYDCIEYIEPRLCNNDKTDPLGTPEILLMVAEDVVVFDNITGKILLIVHTDPVNGNAYNLALEKLDTIANKLLSPLPEQDAPDSINIDESDFNFDFDNHY